MITRPSDAVSVTGLGAGMVYLQFVSDYGGAIVTTLAILVAGVTLAIRVQEFIALRRGRKINKGAGDGLNTKRSE